jgi:hypothetical protein
MTVSELIAILTRFPPEALVVCDDFGNADGFHEGTQPIEPADMSVGKDGQCHLWTAYCNREYPPATSDEG